LSEEGLHDEIWYSYEKTSQREFWSASAGGISRPFFGAGCLALVSTF
jgi:hypothetical protein